MMSRHHRWREGPGRALLGPHDLQSQARRLNKNRQPAQALWLRPAERIPAHWLRSPSSGDRWKPGEIERIARARASIPPEPPCTGPRRGLESECTRAFPAWAAVIPRIRTDRGVRGLARIWKLSESSRRRAGLRASLRSNRQKA